MLQWLRPCQSSPNPFLELRLSLFFPWSGEICTVVLLVCIIHLFFYAKVTFTMTFIWRQMSECVAPHLVPLVGVCFYLLTIARDSDCYKVWLRSWGTVLLTWCGRKGTGGKAAVLGTNNTLRNLICPPWGWQHGTISPGNWWWGEGNTVEAWLIHPSGTHSWLCLGSSILLLCSSLSSLLPKESCESMLRDHFKADPYYQGRLNLYDECKHLEWWWVQLTPVDVCQRHVSHWAPVVRSKAWLTKSQGHVLSLFIAWNSWSQPSVHRCCAWEEWCRWDQNRPTRDLFCRCEGPGEAFNHLSWPPWSASHWISRVSWPWSFYQYKAPPVWNWCCFNFHSVVKPLCIFLAT